MANDIEIIETIEASIASNHEISGQINTQETIRGALSQTGDTYIYGTNDYDELIHKPKINAVTLQGNKTAKQLHLQEEIDRITNSDIEEMLNLFVG